MSIKDGGPAFPAPYGVGHVTTEGMTLRDYFAAKAMQGLISGTYGRNTTLFTEELARESFRLADIMLKEREIER